MFACADQFTYDIRNGRGNGAGGCTETPDFTVADDLSSASLAPTPFDVCQRNNCTTITVSAELVATGGSASFRSRYTERDGTCTFTYTDSGQSRQASGTITFDGVTVDADGSIRSIKTTVMSQVPVAMRRPLIQERYGFRLERSPDWPRAIMSG
jgi:hypothetical protein